MKKRDEKIKRKHITNLISYHLNRFENDFKEKDLEKINKLIWNLAMKRINIIKV